MSTVFLHFSSEICADFRVISELLLLSLFSFVFLNKTQKNFFDEIYIKRETEQNMLCLIILIKLFISFIFNKSFNLLSCLFR